jgi:hypothetical protein
MHGTQTADGRDWLPYQRGTFLTAACAEYVSGHHSTFGAASAEILKRFTCSGAFQVWRHAGARLVAYRPGADPQRPISCSGRRPRQPPTGQPFTPICGMSLP